MTPDEAAHLLHEELEAALADLGGETSTPRVDQVRPPEDLRAGTRFKVALHSDEVGSLLLSLPTSLAMGYLADEEAAVDEWRHWVYAAWTRLGDPSA